MSECLALFPIRIFLKYTDAHRKQLITSKRKKHVVFIIAVRIFDLNLDNNAFGTVICIFIFVQF